MESTYTRQSPNSALICRTHNESCVRVPPVWEERRCHIQLGSVKLTSGLGDWSCSDIFSIGREPNGVILTFVNGFSELRLINPEVMTYGHH